ncbi:MAG: radical SAM protein [Proteobacteria bacterium]|nr:radical SAM protein [Pseudomonadota bacterium]MBU2227030.1 radical SAM protein [Pseudomonadota bacterium]MBU2260636.1 radical SAM protein [Pseudomonadota bacterium]
MKIREIWAKSILSKSQIYAYAVNPYVGCSHACRYCYAAFMKRFTGHKERWGEFLDVKINAPELLAREIARRRTGRVWVSGVCDPYQPLERKYKLTRRCLEILMENGWPMTVQTKSPLVLRDIEILVKSRDAEVGFTITTAEERIRRLFEPSAPPIPERLGALEVLHSRGIKTFAMIAPMLPGAAGLVGALAGKVDHVLVDRLNYHYADRIYRENGMEWAKEEPFFLQEAEELKKGFEGQGIAVQVLF